VLVKAVSTRGHAFSARGTVGSSGRIISRLRDAFLRLLTASKPALTSLNLTREIPAPNLVSKLGASLPQPVIQCVLGPPDSTRARLRQLAGHAERTRVDLLMGTQRATRPIRSASSPVSGSLVSR